jgi:hypothetical protein
MSLAKEATFIRSPTLLICARLSSYSILSILPRLPCTWAGYFGIPLGPGMDLLHSRRGVHSVLSQYEYHTAIDAKKMTIPVCGDNAIKIRGALPFMSILYQPIVLAASRLLVYCVFNIRSLLSSVVMHYLAHCVGYAYYLGGGQIRIASLSR